MISSTTYHSASNVFKVTHDAHVTEKGVVFTAEQVNENSLILSQTGRIVRVRIEKARSLGLLKHLVVGNLFNIAHKVRYVSSDSSVAIREILIAESMIPYRPSGKQVVAFLSENKRFKGIGRSKANKLWSELGGKLFDLLDEHELQMLSKYIPEHAAENLVRNWYSLNFINSIEYCIFKAKVDIDIAYQVTNTYGEKTKLKIEQDPFRLNVFGLSFKKCHELADNFSVPFTSDLRIAGAIEHSLELALKKSKTKVPLQYVLAKVTELLPYIKVKDEIVESVIKRVPARFQIVNGDDLQSNGAFFLESVVARCIANLVLKPRIDYSLKPLRLDQDPEQKGYNEQQVQAINCCLKSSICLVNGAAGTGKTELIRGLCNAFKHYGLTPILLAPTGKAVKVLSYASGESAQTIARYLYLFDSKSKETVLIIDESSMLDCLTMYKLFSANKKIVKIVLLGDQNQLPPPCHGAIFHQLLECEYLPKVTLNQIRRHSKDSQIPHAAKAILAGNKIDTFANDVKVEEFSTNFSLNKRVAELCQGDIKDTQFLCSVNEHVDTLNKLINNSIVGTEIFYNSLDTFRKVNSGLKLGDRVLCVLNIAESQIFNGMNGTITKKYQRTKKASLDSGRIVDSYGQLTCDDGTICELTSKVLGALKLGNAITVHKSQGSQYRRVVIVLYKSTFFTRQMLYTAITRATDKVIILSITGAVAAAISNNQVQHDKCALIEKLEHTFKGHSLPLKAA